MSVREDIAVDIVQKLSNITSPNVVLVTRNPFTVSDLAATQFPAIFVRTTDEEREIIRQEYHHCKVVYASLIVFTICCGIVLLFNSLREQ